MSETTYQLIAIGVYFAAMLAIGHYAYTRTRNIDGYMLAERGLHPAVAALSANAADMSGWLLMGLPGAIYASGLIESWIAIGLTIGAWLNWKFVAPRLRAYTEIAGDSITIPSFFENRVDDRSRALRVAADREESPRLRDLADALRIAPRSVTDVVDALERKGYVVREPDPHDRRASVVVVTDAGRQVRAAVHEARRRSVGDQMGALTATQRAALADALTTLEQGLD